MYDFKSFARSLFLHFTAMSVGELYRTAVTGDRLWELYLATFPVGTNEIYRKRTYHDGSYDRSFIRKMGNVVSINPDGTLTTIWDAPDLVFPYNIVAKAMSAYVKNAALDTLFRTKESTISIESNIEALGDGQTQQWHHFHADIARKHQSSKVDEVVGEFNTTCGVIRRGFTEITPAAVATVLELIEQGTLYRGAEFKTALEGFQRSQNLFYHCGEGREGDELRTQVVFKSYGTAGARLRNSAIGTLLQDLSDGVDLEKAVKSFEAKVAPTNYKRPTALITPKMIELATATIRELGLESALERRFATIRDVSINDVLWADGTVQPLMKDNLTNMLLSEVKPARVEDNGQLIQVDTTRFFESVLPSAISMELFFANQQQSNLMSVTAPVHEDAGSLFKWGNNFAWSYNGNITDSIKEKVKAAGGNTDAVLRVSLAWFNHDDLDLHADCPEGHVYYGNKCGDRGYTSAGNGQILDVDMNAMRAVTRTPVENLSWRAPKDGTYRIAVNQFRKRETSSVGFALEVENDGKITQFSFSKGVADGAKISAITFTVKKGKITDLQINDKNIVGQGLSQEKWGLTTEQFVKINTVLNSPNHWDGESTGNKHLFFILDGCKNDEPARGIYNEFLKPELEAHRKVFEVLGNKTKCTPTEEQLSGLGFSSTKRDSVIVRVTSASSNRLYQINF